MFLLSMSVAVFVLFMGIDTAYGAFVVIGTIFLLLTTLSLIFGEVIDFLEDIDFPDFLEFLEFGDPDAPSLFSLRVISAFFAAFGYSGALAIRIWDPGVVPATLVGSLSGIVFGGIVFGVIRWLYAQGGTSSITYDQLVGMPATVTLEIREGATGRVNCNFGLQDFTLSAKSVGGIAIPFNTGVVVKQILPGGVALVEPIK